MFLRAGREIDCVSNRLYGRLKALFPKVRDAKQVKVVCIDKVAHLREPQTT